MYAQPSQGTESNPNWTLNVAQGTSAGYSTWPENMIGQPYLPFFPYSIGV